MATPRRSRDKAATKAATLTALLIGSLALTACGSGNDETHKQSEPARGQLTTAAKSGVTAPVVATYDGGIYILDGETLRVVDDLRLDGFNRVNPAGDERHIMVSTASGFRVLDAVGRTMTDVEFKGAKPGHVVRHAGKTALFADGTGQVTIFDSGALGRGTPKSRTYTAPSPHHGVAVELSDGRLVVTLGNEEKRVGIAVLDKDHKEITRNENCPGVHGEATARGEAVVIGCQDGLLVYKDGAITKVGSPTAYGRIGTQAGSEQSPIVLGDYKKDPDAELERPEQVSLTDTRSGTMRLVDLGPGTSYSSRSLARGPRGEALVLGTDGRIHVIDPEAGKVVNTIPVLGTWQEPLGWQQPRPAIFVRDRTAYVSDPAAKKLHAVDIDTGRTNATTDLPNTPNEISGVRP
ncbi:zinc metallochaperone AztD [Embleya hyalina]|uniref:Lipoprotein n=1 Tax=Embleya hyalina TaxID=516124 RepID=A0A401YSZ9_9ACTN|nr:zinc metallochaperone AztD [Embleya hyalina]GCD97699.1 hypothetical protein EHYA_05395 [Embleya hyalina]